MIRIGVRELRQNASRYLDKVKAGEVVEVTERGALIALLVAPTPARSAREKLMSTGRLTASTSPFRAPARRYRVRGPQSASDVLAEQREESDL